LLAQLPTQGIFTSCDISVILPECQTRLKTVASAGLKIIVQNLPLYGSWVSSYLKALHGDGLRAMWEMIDPGWCGYNGSAPWGYNPNGTNMLGGYPSWTSACHCKTNGQLLTYIAHTLNSGGATYGWYVADDYELSGSQPYTPAEALAGIKRFSSDLTTAAGGTKTLMSAWGLNEMQQIDQAYGAANLAAQEMYPFGLATDDTQALGWVSNGASLTQQLATSNNGPSAFILQSFSWGECAADAAAAGVGPDAPYPTASEMLQMRNAVLQNAKPSLILWYNLEETIGWATGEQPSDCAAPTDPATRLQSLTGAVKAPAPS
jgi:hypothetical protein